MSPARTVLIAGVLGLTGVAAGAFGAHGLREQLSAHALELWATAARYQQIHAVALLVLGLAPLGPRSAAPTRARAIAALCFTLGILIFAGTLYALALGGPKWLGAITPLGGLALIVGWAGVIAHAITLARARADGS